MDKRPFWLWLNLLSLDAPLVALVWQDFLARCYQTPLLPQGRVVLGLTVWAIYIADRLLDVRGLGAQGESRQHLFYRRHQRNWYLVLGAVVTADALCTVLWVRPVVFGHGLVLAAASVVYLGVFTGTGRGWELWKKLAAAMLFSAGVFVVASASTAGLLHVRFWPWAAFATLCAANLLLIDGWNRKRNRRWLWVGLLLLAVLCGIQRSPWFGAVAMSAVGLAVVAWAGERVSLEGRRVLADVVLFTPLLLR